MKKIEINDATNELLERVITSGYFENAEVAIETSLRLLDERNAKLSHLRELVQAGIDDIEAGRVGPLDMDDIIARAKEKHSKAVTGS